LSLTRNIPVLGIVKPGIKVLGPAFIYYIA